jgi:hypothetical protein
MRGLDPRQRECARRLGIADAAFRGLVAGWARRLQVSPPAARALIAAVHHLGDEGTAIPAFQVPLRTWAEVAGLTVPPAAARGGGARGGRADRDPAPDRLRRRGSGRAGTPGRHGVSRGARSVAGVRSFGPDDRRRPGSPSRADLDAALERLEGHVAALGPRDGAIRWLGTLTAPTLRLLLLPAALRRARKIADREDT